jgi:thimet oligopeptidase
MQMRLMVSVTFAAGLFGFAVSAQAATTSQQIASFLAAPMLAPASVDAVNQRCTTSLQLDDSLRAALQARTGPASIAQDFQAYDQLSNVMMVGAMEMDVVDSTHPDKAIRDAARACASKLAEVAAGVSLSRPIYDRLAAIPSAGLKPPVAYALEKILRNYRLAGVDKDAATRAKVAALKQQIADAGLAFQRNLAEDKSEITLDSVDDLAGMPQDYIDAHQPSADGLIHISTVALDANPLIEFADNEAVRKKMYLRFANRAWPANEATLKTLLARRAALASLLGYPSFAALDTADKMVGTPAHVKAFLDSIAAAAIDGSERDNAKLLAEQKRLIPGESTLQAWNTSYLTNVVKRREYGLDEAQVRQYFTYAKTRDGVFALVHDLFGADIRPWQGAHFWSSDVEGYELYDHGKLVGRFFLDMHPRAGKFQHAKTAAVRMGLADGQIPLAGLICNLAATGPIDHAGVKTFLHEFGHLLHVLYSGRQDYVSQSMMTLQWDFIEAPSQLLEEWIWNADTLQRFATNAKGEPIPTALVAKMNAARHFGEASFWRRQLGLANVSLGYHNQPAGFDLEPMWLKLYDPYGPVPTPEGAHVYAAFGALEDYGAFYYTYVWSKAIALDLFTRFQAEGMRNPQVALAYRKAVLEPGGSESANDLIEHFLGRPMSTAAFRQMLQK